MGKCCAKSNKRAIKLNCQPIPIPFCATNQRPMLSLDTGDFGTIKETLLVNVHTLCEAVYIV